MSPMAATTNTSTLPTSHLSSQKKSDITITTTELPITPCTDPALVLHPSLITQDFDLLRFHAAAALQLPSPDDFPSAFPSAPDGKDTTNLTTPTQKRLSPLLISSPYNQPDHYLNLAHLPQPSRLFALALTTLRPTRPDYATASYSSALNFPVVLAKLRALAHAEAFEWKRTTFYVVVFRSRLREGVDGEWLYKLDYESHGEACERGGLLKYWFGACDDARRNLATCFWHSREDAYKGGQGPWHRKARAAGKELYESIVFSTYWLTVEDGVKGYEFEEWDIKD